MGRARGRDLRPERLGKIHAARGGARAAARGRRSDSRWAAAGSTTASAACACAPSSGASAGCRRSALLFPHLERRSRTCASRPGRRDRPGQRAALARDRGARDRGPARTPRARALGRRAPAGRDRARARVGSPRALLLDEPLASLDLPLRARVLRHLLRMRDELEIPILWITHDPDEAQVAGEIAVVIEKGRCRRERPAARGALEPRGAAPLRGARARERDRRARGRDGRPTSAASRPPRGLRLVLPVALPIGERVCSRSARSRRAAQRRPARPRLRPQRAAGARRADRDRGRRRAR